MLFAAINSGLGTIFVSRDQMRGHKFLLKEPKLRATFSKWQQKHQHHLKHVTSDGRVLLEVCNIRIPNKFENYFNKIFFSSI